MTWLNNIYLFYRRYGLWIYLCGTLWALFGLYFIDSLWGIILISSGALFALSDAAVFWLDRRLPDANRLRRSILFVWALLLLSVAAWLLRYFLDIPVDKSGRPEVSLSEKLRTALLFCFILSYIASLVYRLMLGLSQMMHDATGAAIRQQKQNYFKSAVVSIFGVALAVIVLNYLTVLRNPSIDLSPGYLSFGREARQVIASLEKEVDIYAFIPQQQAVRLRGGKIATSQLYRLAQDVRVMIEQLPLINSRIRVNFLNADLESYDTNEFGRVNNGTLILRVTKDEIKDIKAKPYNERRVYILSERDRNKLESEITRALIDIASPAKVAYFTNNNGERLALSESSNNAATLESYKRQLDLYNIRFRALDESYKGSAAIPENADILFISGPTVPYGEEVQKEILAYLKQGGKLFIAADPSGEEKFSWLWRELGGKSYHYSNRILTNTNFSGVMLTNNFATKHPATENIRKNSRPFVVLSQNGYFEEGAERISEESVVEESKEGINRSSTTEDREKREEKGEGVEEQPQSSGSEGQEIEAIKTEDDKTESEKPDYNLQDLQPQPLFHSMNNSYEDKNFNGRLDSEEAVGRRLLGITYEIAEQAEGPRIVFVSGVNWISERGIKFPVDHKNILFATDLFLWLTANPIVASIEIEKRPLRNVRVTDELKWKLLLFGILVFPLSIGGGLAVITLIYRRKKRFHEVS